MAPRQPVIRAFHALTALIVCAALAGCSAQRAFVEKNLLADQNAPRTEGVAEQYRLACPDVFEIEVKQRPEFTGHYTVEPDGRINLGHYGRLRVEGCTLAQADARLAEVIGARPGDVRARVVEFRSQHLVFIGQVVGWQRTVAYQGPETAYDALQRVGGITPGAAPQRVYVVRAHLGGDQRPEVFHVDLDAIVRQGDDRSNVRLQAFDQIHVGETRQARVEKCIPPWLRPFYQMFWNTSPDGKQATEHQFSHSKWVSP